jgi:hypothetical protein
MREPKNKHVSNPGTRALLIYRLYHHTLHFAVFRILELQSTLAHLRTGVVKLAGKARNRLAADII